MQGQDATAIAVIKSLNQQVHAKTTNWMHHASDYSEDKGSVVAAHAKQGGFRVQQ